MIKGWLKDLCNLISVFKLSLSLLDNYAMLITFKA